MKRASRERASSSLRSLLRLFFIYRKESFMTKEIGSFSHSRTASGSKYEYIISQNQLVKAFNDSRNALNYPLLKESKRQRFLIANSKGL